MKPEDSRERLAIQRANPQHHAMLRAVVVILLLASCAPATVADSPRPKEPPNPLRDAFRVGPVMDEPSLRAAEQRAVELAQLARAAADTPTASIAERIAVKRIAIAADSVRDELLACRRPVWVPRVPDLEPVRVGPWLSTHIDELRQAADDGWVANTRMNAAAVASFDSFAPATREEALYIAPGVRELAREVRALSERSRPVGLVHLPNGAECFHARARLMMGPIVDLDRLRWLAESAEAPARTAPWPALPSPSNIDWQTHYAIDVGRELYVRPAAYPAVALGARVDLALHRDGVLEADLPAHLGMPPAALLEQLIEVSATTPLHYLAALSGADALERVKERSGLGDIDFVQRIARIEPMPEEVLDLAIALPPAE